MRFLDLRFSIKRGILRAYHGIQSERATAEAIFHTLCAFIRHHASETIIVSIKQEDATPGFEDLVRHHLQAHPHLWFLDNRFPQLGEVRGKLVLFSRFGHSSRCMCIDLELFSHLDRLINPSLSCSVGIHPSRWPHNRSDHWSYRIAGTQVLTQDWCEISSPLRIPEKFNCIVSLTLAQVSCPTFKINFTSAAGIYGGLPSIIAKGLGFRWLGLKGINDRLLQFLSEIRNNDKPMQSLGGQVFLMDFVEASSPQLSRLIISFN